MQSEEEVGQRRNEVEEEEEGRAECDVQVEEEVRASEDADAGDVGSGRSKAQKVGGRSPAGGGVRGPVNTGQLAPGDHQLSAASPSIHDGAGQELQPALNVQGDQGALRVCHASRLL